MFLVVIDKRNCKYYLGSLVKDKNFEMVFGYFLS